MGIKKLFTVPEGEKVTEKALRRVLISSICSILLCMTCLVSTTWAWFAVSIENSGNEIVIAEITPVVTIKGIKDNKAVEPSDGSYILANGDEYSVTVNLTKADTSAEVLKGEPVPVYLLITVTKAGVPEVYYIEIGNDSLPINQNIKVGDETVSVKFVASWEFVGTEIKNNVLVIGETETEPIDTLTMEPTSEPASEPITEDSVEFSANGTEDLTKEPSTEAATELSVGIETDAAAGSPTDDATGATADPSTEPSTVLSLE